MKHWSGPSRRSLMLGAGAAMLSGAADACTGGQCLLLLGNKSLTVLSASIGRPVNLFEYGNSFTARGFSAGPNPVQTSINGLSPMLEAMSLGALRIKNPITQMMGNNGVSSTYLAANFGSQVAANFSSFDVLVLFCPCVNDITNGISAITSLANVQSMVNAALAAGKMVIMTNPYFTRASPFAYTTTTGETAGQANDIIGNWARNQPGVIYVDFWNDVVNQSLTTGVATTNMQDSDGLHPASLGVMTVAERALATIGGLYPPAPTAALGQIDFYDATNNPGGNIFSTLGAGATLLEGATGSIGTGCSGQCPTYWSAGRSSGTDTILFTKVAATSGYGALTGDQMTIGVSAAAAACSGNLNIFPNCPSGLVGQQAELLFIMTLPSNVSGLSDILVSLLPNYSFTGGAVWGLRADALSQANWIGGRSYLIRTPPTIIPAGTTALQCQIVANFVTGATVAVGFTRPILRKVLQ